MTQKIKTRARAKKMIRARKIRTILASCFVVLLFATLLGTVSYVEHTYTKQATVCIHDDNTISFIDAQGHEWIADADNVVMGQTVTLKLYTNLTDNCITDDVILNIKPMDVRMR